MTMRGEINVCVLVIVLLLLYCYSYCFIITVIVIVIVLLYAVFCCHLPYDFVIVTINCYFVTR